MSRFLLAAFAAVSLAGCTTLPATEIAANRPAENFAENFGGTVAAADPRAEDAGVEMLRRGGSATDAAIAVMLALTVVEPQSSGIGGGGFLVRGTPDGSVETLDGRETAPASATPRRFLDSTGKPLPFAQATLSGLSVGVPGNIALAAEAHRRYGRLDWAELFEPAIRLARDGFAMNRRLNLSLADAPARAGMTAQARAIFFDDAGVPKPVGARIVQPELARTLVAVAEGGAEAFYRGEFARELAQHVAQATPQDGRMTGVDVESYAAKERPPVCGAYRGYRVCGMGSPSSGGLAVIQILGQLERFDLAALGPRSVQAWHLFVESQRLAYADREEYTGDSDFVRVPEAGLVDPVYLARRSALIDPSRRTAEVAAGIPVGAPVARAEGSNYPDSGTSHIVAVGPDGTMVSYTSTVEGAFGSGLMFGGMYLNNELTDFSYLPERNGELVANRVEGGKRPRSSMSPMVIYDPAGRPFMAVGAAGGPMIPIQTARAIVGVIDFGLPLEQALALPMIMGFGERVIVEEGTWLDTARPGLAALGHETATTDFLFRTVGALWTAQGWVSARDPRYQPLLTVTPNP